MWNNRIWRYSDDGSVMIYMDRNPFRCSLLPTDDDSWTTVRNANGDLIIGLFYPQSRYSNISIADISLLFSQQNLWLTPVTMEKNGIFILKSEVKCAICTKKMEVCLKFIDINTSYIYGKNLELTESLSSDKEIYYTFSFTSSTSYFYHESYIYHVHTSILRKRGLR